MAASSERIQVQAHIDKKIHSGVTHTLLSVEIIIPTLNEGQTVGELIDKMKKVNIAAQVSILVIDGRVHSWHGWYL